MSLKKEINMLEEKAELLKALAHPIRLCIVKRLIEKGKCNVNTMKEHLNLPQSTVSQYLGKLKNANVISCERSGNIVTYYVDNPQVVSMLTILFKQ